LVTDELGVGPRFVNGRIGVQLVQILDDEPSI
jgi:hypothetical protein